MSAVTVRRAVSLAATAAIAATAMTGCSQISSLKQVSGGPVTALTIAAIDVLVEKKVAILEAPTCKLTGADYTCTGSTIDKQPIVVTAPDAGNLVMTIKLNGKVIYSGSVQDVIEKNQRAFQ